MTVYLVILCVSLFGLILIFSNRGFRRAVVNRLLKNEFVEKMNCVNMGTSKKRSSEKYVLGNVKKFLLICLISSIAAVTVSLLNGNDKGNIKYKINRDAPGKGAKEYEVIIEDDSGKSVVNKQVTVDSQEYTTEKLELFANEIESQILMNMLSNNSSVDEIESNLNFDNTIEGYPFDISYSTDSPGLISSTGEVKNEELETPLIVRIRITLCYKDYKKDIDQYVRVIPKRYSKKEKLIKDIESKIDFYDELSAEKEYLYLPKEVDGVTLRYYLKDTKTAEVIIVLGIVVAVLIYIKGNKDIDEKYKKRNNQMMEDYLRIVSQYVLYLSAGMNTRRVWNRICEEYENRVKMGGEERYAYEEMLICQRSMTEGMGEIEAYEGFAKRCALKEYRTFAGLICQVVQKGMENMSDILNQELNNAKDNRIQEAKRKGEDASTKLLFPMLILLSIVIAIVILPAFISLYQGG